ncbi:hypothetical protein Rhopal_004210-T1 [Rhodotorula paludigena]|uniref:ML-like domain-containing protein n=1 Tax=Rhodotorula paludigena TaxID=86838 RepID=A0AAV5GQ98_9BASI|nr:hypothetical protein Rhopal_004210-T1 [Rhodotorula paludigena]
MRALGGLWALAVLSIVPSVLAERRFYARAVSYCSESRAIEINQFLLQYFPDESLFGSGAGAISFDIAAASVDPNLNANLQFSLTAYGIDAVNTTIDLCSLLGGILCPLPTYDFVGSATLPLPAEIGDSIDIPSVGYWIPDLEATAIVRLLRVEDNSEAACLRVDLSNGKTVKFASVSWALGGLAIGCVLLSALWFLVGTLVYPSAAILASSAASSPHVNALWASLGRRKERLFLLMSLLQFVATTGVLTVHYPIIYESYTSNFAWALGLIRVNPVITAIDDLRNSTGGNLTQLAGTSTLVGGTDAINSILSQRDKVVAALPSASEVANALLTEIGKSLGPQRSSPAPSQHSTLAGRALSLAGAASAALVRRQIQDGTVGADATSPEEAVAVPEVQETDTLNAIEPGLPLYLVTNDISPFDAFMVVFINFLFLCCVAIGLAILGGAFWALIRWAQRRKANRSRRRLGVATTDALYEGQGSYGTGWRATVRRRTSGVFMTVLRACTLRLLVIMWYPLLLFTFFQWTLGSADSYAPIVLSVFTIVLTTASILVLAIRFVILARRALRSSTLTAEDGVPDTAPHSLASPFRPTPSAVPATVNPDPSRALLKAERRDVEAFACGQFLANRLAPHSPFWNAYKVRSRRATAKRRNWFKGRGWWFGLVELVLAPFVTALFIGFAHESGWTQTIALLVIQALVFLAMCIWSPYEDKSSNFTHIFWALCRVVIAGALIAFNPSFELNEIARVGIGAVLLVIESVLVVLFFVLLVIDFVQLCIFFVRGIKARKRQGTAGGSAHPVANGSAGGSPFLPQMAEHTSGRPTAPGFVENFDDPMHERGASLEHGGPTRSSTTLAGAGESPAAVKKGPLAGGSTTTTTI